jgi:lipid-A-disaccharide synthase
LATILFCAGDQSGEAHAAALAGALRARLPGLRLVGLGGPMMRAAGVEIVVDQRELAVGGIFELIPELLRIVGAWRRLSRALIEVRPELVVLVDSGGFNLPFARRVRRRSDARILYFIAPQVWAWRPGRIRRLAARADRIVVCLPFERDYYARRGVVVDAPGHPLVDAFAAARAAEPAGETPAGRRARVRQTLGIPQDAPVVGLFPGSRRSELARHLPLQLAAFERLRAREPALAGARAIIGLAAGFDEADVRRAGFAELPATVGGAVRCLATGDGALLDALDVALTKPGTITLEAALHGCPMVVMGRVHPLTAWIARRSAQVRFVALPNLLLEEEIVPELLQAEATPDRMAERLAPLFAGPERERQLAGLARAAARLGPPGAIERTAATVEEMLASPRA